ncbi:MAG: MFS transporter [Peptococcaceae bacterium]|nr:MFS transporter [Peptococcaceae bacterium]
MFWAYGFVFIDRFALSMLFPQVAPDLHLNNAQMGMSMAVFALCWGVSSWIFASLSDIFRAKKLFLVAFITTFSLMSVLTGLVHSFTQLLIVRAIMGIAEGPVIALTQSITMAESHPLRRGANMGFVQASSDIAGMSFCAVLVITLASFFGWRSAFGILAVPSLILAFLIWRFIFLASG